MFQFTAAIMLPCYHNLMHSTDVMLCYFCKIIFNRVFLAEKWWKWSYSNTGRALLAVIGYQSCPNWFRRRRNTARKYSKSSLSLLAFIKPYHGYVIFASISWMSFSCFISSLHISVISLNYFTLFGAPSCNFAKNRDCILLFFVLNL